jgi:hypothetical protein
LDHMADKEVAGIHEKIRSFKKRYYLDMMLRGLILSLSILVIYSLTAAVVEYNLWLGPWPRFVAFSAFFIVAAICVIKFLKEPLQWWIANKGLSEEQSAKLIGDYIPSIKDRLVNFVQLENITQNNTLAYASLMQKSREFAPLSFESVIDLRQNRRYLKYLFIPLGIVLVILFINRSILTKSAERLIFFNREYSPEAPFDIQIQNETLTGFYNEDFTLKVELTGPSVPENAYLVSKSTRVKLLRDAQGSFSYTIEKLQNEMDFQIEAAGYFSKPYRLELANRPELQQLKVDLEYPRYLRRKNQSLVNPGNLEIPEGTSITWKMKTLFTQNVAFHFADSAIETPEQTDNDVFTFRKAFLNSSWYEIELKNKKSLNKDRISYSIDVVKDQYPSITVNNLEDSILFKRILIGGNVNDDYGITELKLHYKLRNENGKEIFSKTLPITINRSQIAQNFFYNWALDSLQLTPGTELEYYLQVWDNDGVHGRKSVKSSPYKFEVPSEENLMVEIRNSESKTNEKIDQSVGQAKKLQDQIDQVAQKLKGKQSMSWQDKKMIEDILQQKESLSKAIEELQEQNKLLEQKKEAFTEQDERIKEKAEQIQKLMDELLDEETKKLFEELQKMLKENADMDEVQKLMNKLNQNTSNLEKELERTLELFKELKYEYKFDQVLQELTRQNELQENILKKTETLEQNEKKGKKNQDEPGSEKSDQQDASELAKEQESLMEDVKENSENLKELKELSEELHKEDELPGEEELNDILNEQEQSKEQLNQNQPSKAKPHQQKAGEQMKGLQKKMESMQGSMEMEMDMENMESLRQIVHGLVKLSFDQESLLKEFNELNPSDPRFNTLAQKQIKLKDDVKVLEDSLTTLSKKDPFMGSVVTKELGELKGHIDAVIESNKERRKPQAATEMQASMTSLNNLALMLDDHLQMMMDMMANAKASLGKQKQKKSGQKPSLSQLQQQLNQRIQELKNSGKNGKQLSEELAELAAEQERIRKALQEMQEKLNQQNGGKMPGDQLPGKMEQTEMDLVNKQLSDQLIRRQQEILTRLLETEKSAREQDMDEERKGETAKDYEKEMPKAFEEYLRLKEKEVELLKTVPPKLYPYYKKEVSDYFKRMGN